ncbi:O-antigen ligase family protein [Mesorhizobium sp. M0045]|uniref:O-antigen ligase family protein n=1 Tax=Mesorhizobium sp. M0045 TaxID=2956857 RepID=UPI00333D26CD
MASAQYRDLNRRDVFSGKRTSFVERVFSAAFSTGSAFSVAMFGFYSLSTMISSDGDDNQSLSIFIRLFLVALVAIAYIRRAPRPFSRLDLVLLPGSAFLLIYTLRLYENIFISGVTVANGTAVVMGIFLASGVIPAYAISTRYRGIKDSDFIAVTIVLLLLMLLGMLRNLDTLVETSAVRMAMDRVNPIALGHLGFSYLIFLVLSFRRSVWIKALAVLAVPALALVIVYARSRGPYLAGSGALLLYVLLLKGGRRVWIVSALGLAGVILGFLLRPDLVDIVTSQLSRSDLDSDLSNRLRVIAFTGAWNQFLDHPFVGRYVIELQTHYYPHNIYLESLMSVGLVGSIPFFIHFILSIRSAVGIIRDENSTIWATFAAVMFFREALGNFVSGGIWGATGFWITSFLTIAVWYGGFPIAPRKEAARRAGRLPLRG